MVFRLDSFAFFRSYSELVLDGCCCFLLFAYGCHIPVSGGIKNWSILKAALLSAAHGAGGDVLLSIMGNGKILQW
jgi:hypothetical protein